MIEYHRETLGLALENRNFQKKFYKNGGFMKGFLKVAGKLGEGKPKSISEEFDQNWGGPDNMYRTPVLQSGTEYVPVSLPQRDAQTLEQANASIEDVSRILGVPAHKLANNDKTSYASQEQENQSFVQDNLRVRAKEWEVEYDYKLLLNKPGLESKMNFEALLRADTKTRMEKYRVMFNAGAINPDQIREFEGMNPREDGGGKEYFTPMNLITNEQLEIQKQQEQKALENE
jgi:HK97 family phage portal protein